MWKKQRLAPPRRLAARPCRNPRPGGYVALGELTVLQQMQKDATLLDQRVMAIGPFARLDAG
jgi:hypothetical protein